MKTVLIGATGTIGNKVRETLEASGHEVIRVGRKTGQYQVDIQDPKSISELYRRIGSFDAVANASGDIAFAPLADLTEDQWNMSLQNKLLGQIRLVQLALPYIREKGSFTLVSGILSEVPILAGVAASTVNRALEGYVMAAACELPKGLRINIVSPTVLKESVSKYGDFFPGFEAVAGAKVAEAYKRSILGVQTGQVLRVV